MVEKCIHHWYLGQSHNGIIHHRCLKCGEEKDVAAAPLIDKDARKKTPIHWDLPEERETRAVLRRIKGGYF